MIDSSYYSITFTQQPWKLTNHFEKMINIPTTENNNLNSFSSLIYYKDSILIDNIWVIYAKYTSYLKYTGVLDYT